jgi:hypothetical protein
MMIWDESEQYKFQLSSERGLRRHDLDEPIPGR